MNPLDVKKSEAAANYFYRFLECNARFSEKAKEFIALFCEQRIKHGKLGCGMQAKYLKKFALSNSNFTLPSTRIYGHSGYSFIEFILHCVNIEQVLNVIEKDDLYIQCLYPIEHTKKELDDDGDRGRPTINLGLFSSYVSSCIVDENIQELSQYYKEHNLFFPKIFVEDKDRRNDLGGVVATRPKYNNGEKRLDPLKGFVFLLLKDKNLLDCFVSSQLCVQLFTGIVPSKENKKHILSWEYSLWSRYATSWLSHGGSFDDITMKKNKDIAHHDIAGNFEILNASSVGWPYMRRLEMMIRSPLSLLKEAYFLMVKLDRPAEFSLDYIENKVAYSLESKEQQIKSDFPKYLIGYLNDRKDDVDENFINFAAKVLFNGILASHTLFALYKIQGEEEDILKDFSVATKILHNLSSELFEVVQCFIKVGGKTEELFTKKMDLVFDDAATLSENLKDFFALEGGEEKIMQAASIQTATIKKLQVMEQDRQRIEAQKPIIFDKSGEEKTQQHLIEGLSQTTSQETTLCQIRKEEVKKISAAKAKELIKEPERLQLLLSNSLKMLIDELDRTKNEAYEKARKLFDRVPQPHKVNLEGIILAADLILLMRSYEPDKQSSAQSSNNFTQTKELIFWYKNEVDKIFIDNLKDSHTTLTLRFNKIKKHIQALSNSADPNRSELTDDLLSLKGELLTMQGILLNFDSHIQHYGFFDTSESPENFTIDANKMDKFSYYKEIKGAIDSYLVKLQNSFSIIKNLKQIPRTYRILEESYNEDLKNFDNFLRNFEEFKKKLKVDERHNIKRGEESEKEKKDVTVGDNTEAMKEQTAERVKREEKDRKRELIKDIEDVNPKIFDKLSSKLNESSQRFISFLEQGSHKKETCKKTFKDFFSFRDIEYFMDFITTRKTVLKTICSDLKGDSQDQGYVDGNLSKEERIQQIKNIDASEKLLNSYKKQINHALLQELRQLNLSLKETTNFFKKNPAKKLNALGQEPLYCINCLSSSLNDKINFLTLVQERVTEFSFVPKPLFTFTTGSHSQAGLQAQTMQLNITKYLEKLKEIKVIVDAERKILLKSNLSNPSYTIEAKNIKIIDRHIDDLTSIRKDIFNMGFFRGILESFIEMIREVKFFSPRNLPSLQKKEGVGVLSQAQSTLATRGVNTKDKLDDEHNTLASEEESSKQKKEVSSLEATSLETTSLETTSPETTSLETKQRQQFKANSSTYTIK